MPVHLESDNLLFAICACCDPRNQLEARGLLLLATYSNAVWLLVTFSALHWLLHLVSPTNPSVSHLAATRKVPDVIFLNAREATHVRAGRLDLTMVSPGTTW